MQTWVVTGAAGHVGGVLVRELIRRGIRPRVLVHEDRRALAGLELDEARGDVRDLPSLRAAFRGAERVLHLAARISVERADEALVQATNVGGVRNVITACREAGIRRLVHVSSIHALSSHPLDRPVDETRPLAEGAGLPPYDRAKSAGEREVRRAVEEGLDAVIVNPTAVLGPFDFRPSAMGQVFLQLYHRTLPGLVRGTFDWVDVRDVVDGLLAAADRAPAGARYLLGGHRLSVPELAALVERTTGRKRPRMISPMWLARAAAPFATGWARLTRSRPLYTRESLHALRNHLDVRHDKAERDLGYRPRPLDETVADAFAWFREQGRLDAAARASVRADTRSVTRAVS